MSIHQGSPLRFGAFPNSSLEIFDKTPILKTILSSYAQKVFPSTSLNGKQY